MGLSSFDIERHLIEFEILKNQLAIILKNTKFDNTYLAIDGSNANTTIDIGSEDLTTTGIITIGSATQAGKSTFMGLGLPILEIERVTSVTNAIRSSTVLTTTSTGDMADGFGGGIVFSINDNFVTTLNEIATIQACRDGADDSGKLLFNTWSTGSQTLALEIDSSQNFNFQAGDIITTGTITGEIIDDTLLDKGIVFSANGNLTTSAGFTFTSSGAQLHLVGHVDITGQSPATGVTATDVLVVIGGKGGDGVSVPSGKGSDISLTSGYGGDNIAGAVNAGAGGDISLITRKGGDVNADAGLLAGRSGALNFTTGPGGVLIGAISGHGGSGGPMTFITGDGQTGQTSDGHGGDIIFQTGAKGAAGGGSVGTNGEIDFKIGGATSVASINEDGDFRIFNYLKVGADSNPTVALDVAGEALITSTSPQLKLAYGANISELRTVSNGRMEFEPSNGIIRAVNTDTNVVFETLSIGGSPGEQNFKHANGTTASPTVVVNAQGMGEIKWRGLDDNSTYITGAGIRAIVDGVPATGIVPMKLQFRTMDDAGTIATHIEIDAAGTTFIGDGGITNYTEFSITGDQVFVGSAGLPFGSFYGNEFNQSQAMTQNVEYQVAHASIATGQSNNITTDGNGKFTITKAGKYKVDWSITASHSAVAKHILWGIALDQALQADGQQHRETIAADKEYNVSGNGIIDVAVGEDIEIGFKDVDDGTPGTALISHMNLSVVQWGG